MKAISEPKRIKSMLNIVFAVVLVLQVLVMVFMSTQKKGLSIDEWYSYLLSNSRNGGKISAVDDLYDNWIKGSDFEDYVVVRDGEGFSYGTVFNNNALDCHPPLYYYILHTFCSFIPNTFSMWPALSISIVCFIVVQIFLFLLSKLLLGDDTLWSLLPVALNGTLGVALTAIVFLRMYMMLAMFTVIFAYLLCRMVVKGVKWYLLLLCFPVAFLGTYTHYFFAIPAFFASAAFCVYLFFKKQFKALPLFATATFLGVMLVFLVYPAALTQITGSETNNVGNAVSSNITNFAALPMNFVKIVGYIGFTAIKHLIAVKWLSAVAVVAIIASLIIFKKRDLTEYDRPIRLLWVVTAILILTTIIIAHVSGEYIAPRYLFHVFPLICVAAIMWIKYIGAKLKLNSKVLFASVIIICCVSCFGMITRKTEGFLRQNQPAKVALFKAETAERPLLVVSQPRAAAFQTSNFMFLRVASDVYMTTLNEMPDIDTILTEETAKNGLVVMLRTQKAWGKGADIDDVAFLDELVENSRYLSSWHKLVDCSFGIIAVVSPTN